MDSGRLAALIASHGYPVIAIVIALESMGLPLPGETVLVTAAIYAGSTHWLHIGPVIAAAAAGAIAGDGAGYWIGRYVGESLLLRHGFRIGLTPQRLAVGHHLFERHGGKVVFFGRFVALLRTMAALLAGINEMPWRRFLIFNAAGGFTWATTFGLGAYVLGRRIERIHGVVSTAGLIGAIIALIVGYLLLERSQRRLLTKHGGPDPAVPNLTERMRRNTDETEFCSMPDRVDGGEPGLRAVNGNEGTDEGSRGVGQGRRQGGG